MTTVMLSSSAQPWTRFGELRRAIRSLLDEPVFTIVLSTSGTLYSITPAPDHDPSSQMAHAGVVLQPFCDLDFDLSAVKVDFSEKELLSDVTSNARIVSYGRPLWLSVYDEGKFPAIVGFAAYKLLGGISLPLPSNAELDDHQKLACLAQRVPIEFLSATYTSLISTATHQTYTSHITMKETKQVASHMRVVVKIEDNLESIVTTSPSEPLLSEAAYYLMSRDQDFHPARALKTILDGFSVNKGALGELVILLLFILARDKAVGRPGSDGVPLHGRRWCTVPDLLRNLFANPTTLLRSTGWEFRSWGSRNYTHSLEDTFKDSKVFFTHFLKPHEEIIVVDFLLCLMARGAALHCGGHQRGIDAVTPFLLKGDEIRRDNIGVIFIQVKNDAKYTTKPQVPMFHPDMDPRRFEVVITPNANIPIIRFVFAVAAASSSVAPLNVRSDLTPKLKAITTGATETYTSYDFWVAGFGSQIFKEVAEDESTWPAVLQISQRPRKLFTYDPDGSRRSRVPSGGRHPGHWQKWVKITPPFE